VRKDKMRKIEDLPEIDVESYLRRGYTQVRGHCIGCGADNMIFLFPPNWDGEVPVQCLQCKEFLAYPDEENFDEA